jgi:hypothetical protein
MILIKFSLMSKMTLIGVIYGTVDGYGGLYVPEVINTMSTKLLFYMAVSLGLKLIQNRT